MTHQFPVTRCPHCGSEDTWLLRGSEISIKEIEGA